MKKSKKHRAIAPAALGGCGGLGQLWEALAELREALGERVLLFFRPLSSKTYSFEVIFGQ